jgi:HEAT repeat protein
MPGSLLVKRQVGEPHSGRAGGFDVQSDEMRFWGIIPLALFAAAPCAHAQVDVQVRTEKPAYLAGEPVFVLVDVKNVGTEPVSFSFCNARVALAVRDGRRKAVPNIWGCSGAGPGFGSSCGEGELPLLPPGRTTTLKYLLSGYRLAPGEYELRASVATGVGWTARLDAQRRLPPSPARPPGDSIAGRDLDRTLALAILPSGEAQLRQAFAPLVEEAHGLDSERRRFARSGISEAAPIFLEKTIVEFIGDASFASAAIDALAEINTAASRADLRTTFDGSPILPLRQRIVRALAGTAHLDNLAFFASILAQRRADLDDEIRRLAVLGIGYAGGTAAVDLLRKAATTANPMLRNAAAVALGNTRSREAVNVLIDMPRDVRDTTAVCGALRTLTHYEWCVGTNGIEQRRREWRRWWRKSARTIQIFDSDHCPEWKDTLPRMGS